MLLNEFTRVALKYDQISILFCLLILLRMFSQKMQYCLLLRIMALYLFERQLFLSSLVFRTSTKAYLNFFRAECSRRKKETLV